MRHLIVTLAFVVFASPALATTDIAASEETSGEAGLDLTLRSNAMAMKASALDGSAIETLASHMLLLDADTGTVLAEKAADAPMYPSSMTKMMTMYIAFQKLKKGSLKLDQSFSVSERAWKMQGSKTFVPLGELVTVEDLIRGIAVQSGNDACIVLAEGIAGSEEAFTKQMNDAAAKLGMKNTVFADSTGWPNPKNVTTPRDLALLAQALVKEFPEYHHYHAEREFTYHGIRQFNRNLLLARADLGVDGIKTGHTDAAGYGITVSAKEPGTNRNFILVVNGLNSEPDRAQEAERLLRWGMKNTKTITVAEENQTIRQAKLWGASEKTIALGVAHALKVTVPSNLSMGDIRLVTSYQSPIKAPVSQGQEVGTLTVKLPSGATQEVKLIAKSSAEKRGVLGRFLSALGM